jgi:hypothetical protein
MDRKRLPDTKYLRECFSYNRTTGELRWKIRPRNHFASLMIQATRNSRFAGKLAGALHPSGYIKIGMAGEIWRAHRIIYKMVTGKEPPEKLDHRDGDQANNRWVNLRLGTAQDHARNRRRSKNNTTGVTGVQRRSNKWRVKIGRKFYGTFDTFDAAVAFRMKTAKKLFGSFYCDR